MSEHTEFNSETNTNVIPSTHPFICICGYCGHTEHKNARIEIHFGERKIYYHCPNCRKANNIDFNAVQKLPYPRMRAMRG